MTINVKIIQFELQNTIMNLYKFDTLTKIPKQ